MPHRKQKNSNKQESPEVSVTPVFDTALPTSLKYQGIAKTGSHVPHIQTSAAPLSPYVIRLSHEHSPALRAQAEVDDAVESLMDQLMNVDLESGATDSEPEVLVDFLDLANQVREDLPTTPSDLKTPIHTPEQHQWESSLPLSFQHVDLASFDLALDVQKDYESQHAEEVLPEPVAVVEVEESPSHSWLPTISLEEVLGSLHYRMTATFIAISLLFVIPIHAMQGLSQLPSTEESLIQEGTAAASLFQEGSSALLSSDFAFAADQFNEASYAFSSIDAQLTEVTRGIGLLASVIPQSQKALRTTRAVVTIGESFSQSASLISRAIEDINEQESLKPTQKIALFDTYLERAEPYLETAAEALDRIDSDFIPSGQQDLANNLLTTIPSLLDEVRSLRDYLAVTNTILGAESQQSYLLVFQNNAELRATGGFMGSFAEITLDQGVITKTVVPKGGTYDVQGQLSTFKAPPGPLGVVNPRWEFQDSNWFPDFRMSAKKVLEFHQDSGGPTMNGVIAINASVLPHVLAITGPLVVNGIELNAENVLFELQRRDEVLLESGEPKALLSDLTEVLFAYIASADASAILAISDVLFTSLHTKDIQLYMRDTNVASLVHDLHWDGAQLPYSFDTLQVVNSNIGGGKSDSVIDQHVDVHVSIEESGRVINTVTITKTHRGISSTVVKGDENRDYVRVYVPRGSELLSTEGFDERPLDSDFDGTDLPLQLDQDIETLLLTQAQHESSLTDIWDENGFTVFGNWIYTKPGETETVSFRYALPDNIQVEDFSPEPIQDLASRIGVNQLESYSLVLQSQSGVRDRETSITISYPPSWKQLWSSVPSENLENATNHVIQSLFILP